MSKPNDSPTPRVKTISVQIKPHSLKRIREIERLNDELTPIVRLTASGDFTAWNLFLWNLVIAKCRGRMDKFKGVDEAAESLADAFESAVGEIVRRNNKQDGRAPR